jgi:hypothetical protein
MEEHSMNRFSSIFTLLFFCAATSWQPTIVTAHSADEEATQATVKINEYNNINYDDDENDDLINLLIQQEEETSLNLNGWQRFKRWFNDKYNETKVITSSLYDYKIKPFAQKHKKAIIGGTTSVGTLLVAYLLYRNLISKKQGNLQ